MPAAASEGIKTALTRDGDGIVMRKENWVEVGRKQNGKSI